MPKLALRSPLAFPTGQAPGFDPSHPASNFGGNGASFIPASGGVYINLLTGQPTAKVFTQSYGVGAAGPYVQSNTSTGYGTFPNTFPTTVSPGFTIAGIFTYVASQAGGGLLATSNTSASGIQATIRSGVFGYRNGSLYPFSPALPTMVVGTPYFVALSDNGTTCYGVQVNMLTGQISTSSVATASGLSQGSTTTWNLGGQSSGNTQAGGNIHALMGAFVFLPPAQLKAWAADPWSFWYPQKFSITAPTNQGTFVGSIASGIFNLIGAAISSAAGFLSPNASIMQAGGTASSTAASPSPSVSVPSVGASASSTAASPSPSVSIGTAGASASSAPGLLSPSVIFSLIGGSAASVAGFFSFSGSAIVALVGAAASAVAGAFSQTVSANVTGSPASAGAGSLSPSAILSLIGAAASSIAGILTATGGAVAILGLPAGRMLGRLTSRFRTIGPSLPRVRTQTAPPGA